MSRLQATVYTKTRVFLSIHPVTIADQQESVAGIIMAEKVHLLTFHYNYFQFHNFCTQ